MRSVPVTWVVPGVTVLNRAYFNEFTVILPRDAREAIHAA